MTARFRWVSRDALLLLHGESLAEHGGRAGVRDAGLLESALARPRHLVTYGNPSVFALAACYSVGLAKNHPFIDGNKRVALLAIGLFLALNGHRLRAGQVEATQVMLSVAAGTTDEAALARWLAARAVPSPL